MRRRELIAMGNVTAHVSVPWKYCEQAQFLALGKQATVLQAQGLRRLNAWRNGRWTKVLSDEK